MKKLKMTIYNLYIFDRIGTCLHYGEWHRRKDSNMPQEEEFKLMYGMLFSLKSFVNRMSPTEPKDAFLNYRTNRYKLHFYETPTGMKFILNTDVNVANVKEYLHEVYKIYVDYVVKNPMSELGKPIETELFTTKLNSYIQSLPIYT